MEARFEYYTFSHWEDLPVRPDAERPETLNDRLNNIAEGGWRVVSVTAYQHRNGFLIVMERPAERKNVPRLPAIPPPPPRDPNRRGSAI